MRAERALAAAAAALAIATSAPGEAPPAAGATYQASVVHVRDGDTLIVRAGERQRELRIAEIDAPEQGQPFGEQAERALAALVAGRPLRVELVETDPYGREVSKLWVGERCVACELVRGGYAWAYRKYLRDPALLDFEREAREARRGLWSQPRDAWVPPSAWRRGLRSVSRERLERHFREARRAEDGAGFTCAPNARCSEMSSCAEARFQLEHCEATQLDRDGDGVPCDQRCR